MLSKKRKTISKKTKINKKKVPNSMRSLSTCQLPKCLQVERVKVLNQRKARMMMKKMKPTIETRTSSSQESDSKMMKASQ